MKAIAGSGILEPMSRAEILKAALDLPEQEREQLVEELSASLHGGFATKEIEESWEAEVARRLAEIDAGTAVLHDWPEVRDELLAELRGQR